MTLAQLEEMALRCNPTLAQAAARVQAAHGQYLQAGLIDDLHLAARPILIGRGENLFQGLDWKALGYECAESKPGERAMHVFLRKR